MHNHTELIKEEGVCDVGELALLLFGIGYFLILGEMGGLRVFLTLCTRRRPTQKKRPTYKTTYKMAHPKLTIVAARLPF